MKKILGMPLALVLIGMLVIGGATAAIVGYLSNTVEVTTEVKSPLTLEIKKGSQTQYRTMIDDISFYNGERLRLDYKVTNLADVGFDNVPFTVIISTEGKHMDLAAFTGFFYEKDGVLSANGYPSMCTLVSESGKYDVIECNDYLNIDAGDFEEEKVILESAGNIAPLTYNIETQLMYGDNTQVVRQ